MSFRNIIVESRAKLEYSLNYMVVRTHDSEKRILISEIQTLIIVSTQVSITSSLISELSKNKVKIIFCNEEHNPECEMVPYQNHFYSYRKIKEQIQFIGNNKEIWQKIIKEKIMNQARVLLLANKNDSYNKLMQYYDEVEPNDITNREGHAAKVYFNSLFGFDFSRKNDCSINKYLNYGYSILLSAINREIKMLGYLTELGIHHIGESNPFNFSCDLIEPLRPIVDSMVVKGILNDDNFKTVLVSVLQKKVYYQEKEFFLDNAIHLFVLNVISCLKEEPNELSFIDYEL